MSNKTNQNLNSKLNSLMKLVCKNAIDEISMRQVNQICKKRFGQEVELEPIPPSFRYDIGTISSVAGLIIGIVAIYLHIRDKKNTTSRLHKFNADSASDHLVAELNSHEIRTIKVVKFTNFNNFSEMNGQSCEISAYDSTIQHEIKFSVNLTKDSCTITKNSSNE